MVRRLSVWVLAFVIVGAPVATAVCQVMCETHQNHDMEAMSGHHAHHSRAVESTIVGAVIRLPHACEHPFDEIVAVQQALQVLSAPVLVAVPPSFVSLVDVAILATQSSTIEHSPPGTVALIAQLRV